MLRNNIEKEIKDRDITTFNAYMTWALKKYGRAGDIPVPYILLEFIQTAITNMAASITGVYDSLTADLSNASTYQNNSLIGVDENSIFAFFAGSEMQGTNLISSFDSLTGTITFNSTYTPLYGDIKILYKTAST